MPIPKSVTHEELNAALEPLCDLLGTSVRNWFADPGMSIRQGEITFTVPVRHEESPTGRVPSLIAGANAVRREDATEIPPHPQGRDEEPVLVGCPNCVGELGYAVSVAVTLGDEVTE